MFTTHITCIHDAAAHLLSWLSKFVSLLVEDLLPPYVVLLHLLFSFFLLLIRNLKVFPAPIATQGEMETEKMRCDVVIS